MTVPVSLGLPVYNGERYLAETLDSILAQEFGDFELIISDNASSDATRDICEEYCRRDSRLRYSRLPNNVGAARNYNRVFSMATGELFKWAAHDDLLHPAFLASCVEAFEDWERLPCVVYPKAEFIDERGIAIGPDPSRMLAASDHSFVRGFQVLQGMGAVANAAFGLFRRDMLRRTRLIGGFFAADCVLLLEVGLLGRVIQLEGPPLFQRRIHPEISTKANVSIADRLRWYDPEARSKLPPDAKLLLEYLRSPVRMSELSAVERALCIWSIVLGVGARRTRVVLGRHRRRLASGLFARS